MESQDPHYARGQNAAKKCASKRVFKIKAAAARMACLMSARLGHKMKPHKCRVCGYFHIATADPKSNKGT